jgi:hypothetical protein
MIRRTALLVLAIAVTTVTGVAVTVVALFAFFHFTVAANRAAFDSTFSTTTVARGNVLIITFFGCRIEKAIAANVRRAIVQAGIVVRDVTVIAALAELSQAVATDRILRTRIDWWRPASVALHAPTGIRVRSGIGGWNDSSVLGRAASAPTAPVFAKEV